MKTARKRGARKRKVGAAASRPPRVRSNLSVVRVAASPVRLVSEVEERLSEALARLARLNAEHDALRDALAEFEEQEAERLGDVVSALHRARQIERRLERIEEELRATRAVRRTARERRAQGVPRETPRRRPTDAGSWLDSLPPKAPGPPEPEWDIKALYRRLARRLHPDRAANDEDRARRGRLMIRLNAAFAAEDRVRLELMATEIEQGEGTTLDDPVNAEAHMQRRLAELSPLSDKLELELRRTRAAAAYRRLQDARGREATGQDYFREVREQTAAQARAARATFAERGARIEEAARALNAHFVSKTRAPGKAGTDFSALEPPLPYRLAITAAEPCSGAADVSGKSLRRLAREAPWKAAWVMAAVFAEIAGRPPAGLATFSAWSTWHETLRAGRRAVPAFEDALGELPAVLEVGCRLHHDGLRFGVMLRDPDGSAFDPEAMAGAPCSQLAADLLTALAPRAECGACERVVPLVHVHRLRDVDPLHAFVCSRCGEVLEKYRAVGRAEGFEALAPYAVAVGLVEELTVWFGSTTFRIGLLTKERRRLTSERLAQIFFEAALGSDDAAEHPGGYAGAAKRGLSVSADGRRLARGERVPRAGKLELSFRGKGPSEKDAVAAMQLRHRKRFRQA